MKNIIVILTVFLSFLFSQQNPWGGMSVSTADNLDALSLNPAGLGVKRDSQVGLSLFNIQTGNASKYIFHMANRDDGFGSTFQLKNNANKSNLYYSLGLGFSLEGEKMLGGIQWFSDKRFRFGSLIRPINRLSIGMTADYNQNMSDWSLIRLGAGIRPLEHRVTFGADLFSYTTEFDNIHTSIFAEVVPMEGLKVSLGYRPKSDKTDEEFQISVGFNFGVVDGFFSQEGSSSGFGARRYSQVRPTMFKIKKKEKIKFVEMRLNGAFIEEPVIPKQFSFSFSLPSIFGLSDNVKKIQLKKWIDRVDQLTEDKSIQGMVIYLENIGGGFAKLAQAREALNRFKAAGKTIIVYSNGISNVGYYFVSMADEIYVPDLSAVDLRGLVIQVRFFKDMLDSLDIVAEVEQISPYKSAMDPFIRNSMSDEMRENYTMLFDDIYDRFVSSIASGRGWSIDKTKEVINKGPYLTKDAIKEGLITDYMYPDKFEKYKKERNDKKINLVSFGEIGSENSYNYNWVEDKEKIAVIYAVGGINVGKSKRQGSVSEVMGNETISKAIKTARKDKDVKAIVLRIDSGGGSALASDLMWKEIWNTTVADTKNVKPFIASMSDVAASGGYYIACQADTIVADSSTITGSIGVISGRINLSGLWEKFYTNTDRIKFGERSDIWSGSRLWTEEERLWVRQGIIDIYGTFLSRVAGGRETLDSLDVHEVGIGKVWSGVEAKELGLVDVLGDLNFSIEIAKEAAGIDSEEDIIIDEYPKKEPFSFSKIFGGKEIKVIKLDGPLKEMSNTLNALPNFENDRMQMILPVEIIIK